MNKKSTLIAAALMAVSSLTVSAEDAKPVPSTEWAGNNYYHLQIGTKSYLAISPENRDSVVLEEKLGTTKEAIDLTLWKIVYAGTETSSNVYQFVNKKTKQVLSFAKDLDGDPILAEGIDKWSFSEDGKGFISAKVNSSETMTLSRDDKEKIVFKGGTQMTFSVVAPEVSYSVKPSELGDGFTTFQLSFGEEFEGDIFSGKDLIAVTKYDGNIDDDYFMLQEKGDEAYADGVKKFLGVDTLTVEGAGNSFSLDSIRTTIKPNKDAKLFKFTADLKNDSLTMIVKSVPAMENAKEAEAAKHVVYAQLGTKKVLTIGGVDDIHPFITASRGVPAEISGGTGVYFLKSASKGAMGGKYISSYDESERKIKVMAGTPSVNQLEGQWYIKEDNGMYSIVDRKSNTSILLKGEVFAVQGIANTFTFGGSADSITVEPQKVNLDDKYLGSLHFSKEDLANNGYVLNLLPAGAETSNSYTFTSDSLLKVTTGDAKDAVLFKLDSVGVSLKEGAQKLNDTVSVVTYKLKSQFSNKYVAYDKDKKCLKISTEPKDAIVFRFNTSTDGGKYDMKVVSGENVTANKYISADLASSNMVLSETPAYFNFVEMEAPEYGTFDSGNKRFTSDLKSLTMNPFSRFAEAKQEGQDILKSTYEKDNFSLWLSKSKASTAEKPLYFIMTSLAVDGDPNASRHYFYMVSGRDSSLVDTSADKNYRVHFIKNDTIETMKDNANNPALFALKVTESGNYLLENQKELNSTEKSAPYVGIINNVVVMTKDGVEFSVETAPAPVANEEIEAPNTVKVIGGVGEFSIRNAHGKKITVSNILGQTIATRVVSSDYVTVPTTRGVVIVSVDGDQAYKVIVK
ncbi:MULTISPECIES: DUF6383 domain-containing protein [Parabacteroides]|uniref:DUF6383 domain-containing protein n=1 Tax=Parabacteroides leei TaxID=2939491 RepID=UPI00189B67CB|nr:DUF6383 domain-containing protein [Parabacteroides goldsteinii]